MEKAQDSHQTEIMDQHQVHLHVEQLEKRQLLAGTVFATVSPTGNLIVNGDGNDNDITVVVDQAGFASVTGNDGESIVTRGLDQIVTRNVTIRLKGGDDSLLIQQSQINGKLRVASGAGNDNVQLRDSELDSFRIAMGGGNDRLTLDQLTSTATTSRVIGNSGSDTLQFEYDVNTGPQWNQKYASFENVLGEWLCDGDPNDVTGLTEAFANRGPDWAGADLMDIVNLPDGSRLWIFGDTFYGEVNESGALAPGFRIERNSAVLQRGTCFEVIVPAAGGSWVPGETADSWLWPQESIVVGDELFAFMVQVETVDNGVDGLNFQTVGGSLAVFDLDDLTQPTQIIENVPTHGTDSFGWGAITDGDFHYLYAHPGNDGTHAARAPVGEITNFEAWRFWDGTNWIADSEGSVAIHPDRLRIHRESDGSIGALSLPFLSRTITSYTSQSPVGAFQATSTINLNPIWPSANSWAYQPVVVPGLDAAGNQTIAFNFNSFVFSDLLDDIHLYGPSFVTR